MTRHIDVDVATADDLPWIAALELKHYGGERAVAETRLVEWFAANRNAFFVIREGGRPSGHATLLPLRPRMMHALANGTRNEGDIGAADLFGPHERLRIRDLYMESLIAEPMDLLGQFIGNFDRHVARLAEPIRLRRIYAYPITDDGRRLMANLNFQRAHEGCAYSVRFRELAVQTAAIRRLLRRR